jgi:predicted metal-binding membrane protein
MKPLAHRDVFLPTVGALIALAWLTLAVWEGSSYGRYLKHSELAATDAAGGAWPPLAQAAAYVVGWTLMTIAMMLPTALPLVEIFRRLTRDRGDRGTLVSMLILGYLAIWMGFGILAHTLDWGLHELYEESAWLQGYPWIFSAGVLFVAGAYQFSALKYRCLDECRSPLGFVMRHWHGSRERLNALVLGVHHGLFCVGCCWALMLLMFAIGTGSVGWMLVLGAVMATEKNMPWGRKMSAPLGLLLLAWSALIVMDHSWSL